LYHLVQSGQTGDVTRIASACTTEEEEAVQQWFRREVQQLLHHHHHHHQEEETKETPPMARDSSSSSSRSSLRFHLHLTPDYSNARPGHSYVYFNKAFGMKHWMEHSLGYNSINDKYSDDDTTTTPTRTREPNEHDDTIIILLDPDQLVLKPFTHDYTNIKHMGWVRGADQNENSVVQRGTSISQLYGFADQWHTKINVTRLFYPDDSDNTTTTLEYPESESESRSSALWNVTEEQQLAYAAGPPYLAVAQDMYQIVHQWAAFAPRVHVQYPWLISEMFAYSLAAVHVHLPPRTVTGFMVSSAYLDRSSEGWSFMDVEEQDSATTTTSTTTTIARGSSSTSSSNSTTTITADADGHDDGFQCLSHYQRQQDRRPYVLHYCQEYFLGKWYFYKTDLPNNFISCEADLLRDPSDTAANLPPLQQLDYGVDRDGKVVHYKDNIQLRQRQAWMLCTLISALNQAAIFYKERSCSNDTTTTTGSSQATIANYNKTWVFHWWNFTM
jgi:peptidyl serine alpha-galactosyltransferase